ncbi:SDR family oxidoreductase [Pedobacter hiemivivus]|uniref:SDR family oxidoreductase n=1 Tax=Pedobacter hiemivivus TaxID=2530454 RepID=A0A4R0MV53_9SPHI|nr:SDR family oxidoreductase [Pedobacter hiemivivus]TCC91038.1 SDR family oxidoreductase [Pedobacter hiemivivus]
MIAITGASGHLGKATINHLLKKIKSENIVAIVRDPLKLAAYKDTGIKIRTADYNDLESLITALAGVNTLLHISTTSMGLVGVLQENNVVRAADWEGVKHIVYTSGLGPKADSYFLAVQQCLRTEEAIINSKISYTFFRNSLYMETIPQFIGNALQDGHIYFPAGAGKVSFVSREDIAEALSVVLTETQHQNKVYEVTGSKAFSFQDIASLLSLEKKFSINYMDIPAEFLEAELIKTEMPEDEIGWFLSLAKSIKANEFAPVEDCLEVLLKRKPLALKEYLTKL